MNFWKDTANGQVKELASVIHYQSFIHSIQFYPAFRSSMLACSKAVMAASQRLIVITNMARLIGYKLSAPHLHMLFHPLDTLWLPSGVLRDMPKSTLC